MRFIVELNKEYNRVYETAGRYPDVALAMLSQAFSLAVFENKKTVTIEHVRKAIEESTALYPDIIKKGLVEFDKQFGDLMKKEEDMRRDFYE